MLDTDQDTARGRSIPEVVRNAPLREFIIRSLKARETTEDDLEIRIGEHVVHVQAHGVRLEGGVNTPRRALVVLNDVTRIHRLENVRQDFVANVSHELKTPVTSILGFVETCAAERWRTAKTPSVSSRSS